MPQRTCSRVPATAPVDATVLPAVDEVRPAGVGGDHVAITRSPHSVVAATPTDEALTVARLTLRVTRQHARMAKENAT